MKVKCPKCYQDMKTNMDQCPHCKEHMLWVREDRTSDYESHILTPEAAAFVYVLVCLQNITALGIVMTFIQNYGDRDVILTDIKGIFGKIFLMIILSWLINKAIFSLNSYIYLAENYQLIEAKFKLFLNVILGAMISAGLMLLPTYLIVWFLNDAFRFDPETMLSIAKMLYLMGTVVYTLRANLLYRKKFK